MEKGRSLLAKIKWIECMALNETWNDLNIREYRFMKLFIVLIWAVSGDVKEEEKRLRLYDVGVNHWKFRLKLYVPFTALFGHPQLGYATGRGGEGAHASFKLVVYIPLVGPVRYAAAQTDASVPIV